MSLIPLISMKVKLGREPSSSPSLRQRATSLTVAVLPVPGTPDMYIHLCTHHRVGERERERGRGWGNGVMGDRKKMKEKGKEGRSTERRERLVNDHVLYEK